MPIKMTIRLTSEDINLLIVHYLEERGLRHSAFTLQAEAGVSDSPVAPGRLLEVLYKALLMEEITVHGQRPPHTLPCTEPFTLLSHCCAHSRGPLAVSRGQLYEQDCVVLEGHSQEVNAVCFVAAGLLSG